MTSAFTELVAVTRLSVGFGIFAVAFAVLCGALHAFAPGHGKTLMAAYLVGRNGSPRQAALLGASVTVTHTAGVLVLGLLLSVAVLTAPEQIYPWLSMASGVLLAAIGLSLLRSARRQLDGHSHNHDHAVAHGLTPLTVPRGVVRRQPDAPPSRCWPPPDDVAHDPSHPSQVRDTHPHSAGGRVHQRRGDGETRSLLAVGFVGGMVPSPSALVVLLGGIALGRAWFGVLLVIAYGTGMALALVGIGLVLVRARGRIERWSAAKGLKGRRPPLLLALTRRIPALTAGLVIVMGLVLATQALLRL